jgi:hypothetical protein
MSRAAPLPRPIACAKWKRWLTRLAVVRVGTARNLHGRFSNDSNLPCGILLRRGVLPNSVGGLMPHRQSRRTANCSVAGTLIAPTPERYRHGAIEPLERSITDMTGTIARPHYAVDTLLAMERRGSITAAMRQAGEDFRRQFVMARLDPLRALDWSQPKQTGAVRTDAAETGSRIERAREFVWRTIGAVGGFGSPGGSCLWHVVGWERSLKEWALGQGWNGRRVSPESASGILIAVLGTLDAHYRRGTALRKRNLSLDKSGSI